MAADGAVRGYAEEVAPKLQPARLGPVVILLIALGATAVHLAVNGYSFGGCTERLPAASPSGDHANILPWVYWYQDNSLFPHDLQIQSGAAYATVLWRMVAWCGRAISLPYVFFTLHLIALVGTYAALFSLGQLLGENAWAGGMACALFIVAHDAPAGEATHDPAFYTRMAALPLVLAAVHGALRARPILTFGSLAAAVAVHLLSAAYAAPIVLALWLFSSGRSRLTRGWWMAGFFIIAALIVYGLGGSAGVTLGRPTDQWLDLQRGNNEMHLFASRWPWAVWQAITYAGVFLLLPLMTGMTPLLRRFATIIVLSCGLLALAGWLFAEKQPSMLVMQLQPLRGLKIGMILALVCGAAWLCRTSTPIARLTAAACLVAWTGHYYPAFLIVLTLGLVLQIAIENRIAKVPRAARYATVAISACAFAALLVRSVIESVEVADGRKEYRYRLPLDLPWRDSTSPWVEVQRWVAAHTPQDAFFMTPPILEGFRTHARRSEYADWKQGTLSLFHERFGMEWLRRLARLMGSGGRLTYIDIYNRYNGLTAGEFHALAAEFGLTHAVTMKPVPGLTPLHQNRVFFVYQLR